MKDYLPYIRAIKIKSNLWNSRTRGYKRQKAPSLMLLFSSTGSSSLGFIIENHTIIPSAPLLSCHSLGTVWYLYVQNVIASYFFISKKCPQCLKSLFVHAHNF